MLVAGPGWQHRRAGQVWSQAARSVELEHQHWSVESVVALMIGAASAALTD